MIHEYRAPESLAQFDIDYCMEEESGMQVAKIKPLTVHPILINEIVCTQVQGHFASQVVDNLILDETNGFLLEWPVDSNDDLRFFGCFYIPGSCDLRWEVKDKVHHSKLSIYLKSNSIS